MLKIENKYNIKNTEIIIDVNKSNSIMFGYIYLNFKVNANKKGLAFNYEFDEPVDYGKIVRQYFTLEDIIEEKIKDTLKRKIGRNVKIDRIKVS